MASSSAALSSLYASPLAEGRELKYQYATTSYVDEKSPLAEGRELKF